MEKEKDKNPEKSLNDIFAHLIQKAGIKELSKNEINNLYNRLFEIALLSVTFRDSEGCKILMVRHLLETYKCQNRYILPQLRNNKQTIPDIRFDKPIFELIKKTRADLNISIIAMLELEYLVNIICDIISTFAKRIINISGNVTLSQNVIKNTISIIFRGSLAIESLKKGEEVMEKFSEASILSKKKKGISKTESAGIIFPPSKIEKILRNHFKRIASGSSVYLAAIVEYLIQKIIELTVVHLDKRYRIQTKHLEMTIRNDKELESLFFRNKIEILNGRYSPNSSFEQLFKDMCNGALISAPVFQIVQMEFEKYLLHIL